MLLAALNGWLDRRQQETVSYLVVENRVLRKQLQGRRLRLSDEERCRLAIRGHRLGVRPSNRRDNHIPSCCVPTVAVAALGDGRVGVRDRDRAGKSETEPPFTRRGGTA